MAVDASPGAGRVLIADAAGPLVAEPTWARYDNLDACRCSGFDWNRGRQSELDITNTGTARVFFHDRDGTFDGEDLVGLQIMLQLFDPVAEEWQPVFRGHIDDIHNEPHPEAPDFTNVQVDCVGIFAYLEGVKMVVGTMGEVLTGDEAGVVKWASKGVNLRMEDLWDAAGIDDDLGVFFTGNVDVWDTFYDTDDTILTALRDAADAEFPGVANLYEDRFGRCVFHGRFAKFDPDTTASGAEWTFVRWAAATRADVTTGRAQIREFRFNRPRTRIINSYVSWPDLDIAGDPFAPSVIANNTKTDPTSIAAYGYHGQEAPALIIKQHKTNGNTGLQECELFADYYVANYAVPRKNIERVTFKTLHPDDDRAGDTWAIMCGMDISDVIHLFVAEAGLSDEEYFIEGITGSCRVGAPGWDFVEVTPNLSPAAYYTDNVFEGT